MHLLNHFPSVWSVYSTYLLIGLIVGLPLIGVTVLLEVRTDRLTKLREKNDDSMSRYFSRRIRTNNIFSPIAALFGFSALVAFLAIAGPFQAGGVRHDAIIHSLQSQAQSRYGITLSKQDAESLAFSPTEGVYTVKDDLGSDQPTYRILGEDSKADLKDGKVSINNIQLVRVGQQYILTKGGVTNPTKLVELPRQ